MAFPGERQKTAERLARELGQLGATVTNVLPLAAGQNLRFWVSDYEKREVLTALADAGYVPIFIGMSPQMCIKTYSMGLVNNFELALPADQPMLQQNRTIPKDEVGSRERQHSHETEAIVAEWYGMKKR